MFCMSALDSSAVDCLTFGPHDIQIETKLLIWFTSQEIIVVVKGATCPHLAAPQMMLIT